MSMPSIKHIKQILLLLFLGAILCSCSQAISVDIRGKLSDNAASEVYLVVEDTQIDTLARAKVGDDNTFHLKGEVTEPRTAFICDDNGNALAVFLAEKAKLELKPQRPSGYMVEGGPINDKYNLILKRISALAEQAMNIDFEKETAQEEYESLTFKHHDAIATAISDNLDNIIGAELFLSYEVRGMTAEDMRVRFGQFSKQMQNLSVMREFEKYISIFEKIEIGKNFLDAEVESLSGDTMHLKEVCGRGKWVLVDFWATWCEPCLEQMPQLKALYEKYVLQGFEVLAISLDKEQARWKAYVEQNGLLWLNAIDTDSPQSAAKTYGLQSIPSSFLISPEGKIVARDLDAESLAHELEHIFGDDVH